MADQTNNPTPPSGQPAPTQAAGPARAGVDPAKTANDLKSSLSTLAKSAPEIREVMDLLKTVSDIMDRTESRTEQIRKQTKDWGSELRHAISYTDDIQDAFKLINDYQKKMSSEGLKVKDYRELVAILKEMKKVTSDLASKGVLSREHTRILDRQVKAMGASLTALSKKTKETFDSDYANRMLTDLVKMNRVTVELSKNIKGVRITGLSRDLSSMERSLAHVRGANSDRIGKWIKYGETGAQIRKAVQDRDKGRVNEFRQQRDEIVRRLPRLNIDSKKYLRPDGSVDQDKMKEVREERKKKIADTVKARSKDAGISSFGTSLLTRAAIAKSGGAEPGMLTRFGLNALARGEGSVSRGLLSWGSGMIEGGAGSVSATIGAAAPIVAGLELLREMFDKNAELNKQLVDKVGQGGILTSGSNTIDDIRNVRSNLDAPLYSRYGISYEKNLELARALVDSGLSTVNLAQGRKGRNSEGFSNDNSFGRVQQNAYLYGRLAGLGSTQTLTETIKLITEYGRSLESTDDFFISIQKDTQAAGLSTTKWISLVDAANSQYDRSNKLLMTTVTTMRLLSSTGRNTAEDLKEAMDTVTNGGQKRSLEQNAYLGIQAMKDPDMRRRYASIAQGELDNAIESLTKVSGLGITSTDVSKGLQARGFSYLSDLRRSADTTFSGDPLGHQSANTAINSVENAFNNRNSIRRALAMPTATQAGIALASRTDLLGSNFNSDSLETMTALEQALRMSKRNLSDYMTPEGRASLSTDPMFLKSMEALNLSPEKMKRVPQLLETFSDSMLKVVQNGITDKDQGPQREAKQGLFEEIYRELTNRGYRFNEKDHAKAVQGFANDRNNRLADMLPSMRGVFRDLFASADVHKIFQQNVSDDDKKIQREKAAQLTADTRTTADVFSDAFSSLFNTISEPLEMIVKLLSFNLPGFFERNKWSSDSTKRVTGDLDRAGITDRAFESAQAALDRMRYDAMNENDPARKGALNTRIEKTRRQLSDARGTLATYHQGKGVLDSDLQSANAFIKQFGGFDHAASPDELAAFSRSIGLSKNSDGSWSGVVSDAAEKDLQDIFKQLKGFGQVKVSQQPSANGKGDTWNVVTNYHSVNVDQMPPQTSSLRDSGERPKVPTKAGQ